MLKTTSQQLIDSLGFDNGPGQPLAIGAAIDQAVGAKAIYEVPVGQVLLITQLVIQPDSGANFAGFPGSPSIASSLCGFSMLNAAGGGEGSIAFRGFSRYQNTFSTGTPDWRSSTPGGTISWKPKYPIMVPAGWTLQQQANVLDWGNNSAAYGIVVSEESARTLGFQVEPSSTDLDRRLGVVSSEGSVSAATIITGREGQSIRILDVYLRMQPQTRTTNTLLLQQVDGTPIFKTINNNPAEFLEQSFSPGWFLKAGQGLQIDTDVATGNSIVIAYEFVPESEIPGDAWFAVVEPGYPTPGGTLVGAVAVSSTEVSCYYPKYGTTKTSPTKGFQHMLNGYTLSVQKALTAQASADDTEQTRMTISSGDTAGRVNLGALLLTQPNLQLSPVFSGSGHDQCTWAVVDGINLPCQPDDGSIWIDSIGFDGPATTPTNTTNHINGWAVNLWGRTITTKFTPRENKGA